MSIFNKFIQPKVIDIKDYPPAVKMEVIKRFIIVYLLVGITIAGTLVTRKLPVALVGLSTTILYLLITLHFIYLFTRDKVYILEGIVDDVTIDFIGIARGNIKKIKLNAGDDNIYYIQYKKPFLFPLNIESGSNMTIYATENAFIQNGKNIVNVDHPLLLTN